jgi:transposase
MRSARSRAIRKSERKPKTSAISSTDSGGKVEVVFEEGTHSAWLYKLLKPLVASVTVCDPRHNKLIGDGNKSDDEDAETLAQLLRMSAVKAVYKGDQEQQQLKELCRAYDNLVEDSTRTQNRLKAIYRGRGIDCPGHAIYRTDQRTEWLAKLLDEAARFRAASLLEQLDSISQLRKQAKQRLVAQARRHPDYPLLMKLPGFGPVRVAQLIAIVGTPFRFRTKRQLRALLRLCCRHTFELRLWNRRGEDCQTAEEGLNSRVEPQSQSAAQTGVQRRSADCLAPQRSQSLLPALD